MKKIISKSPTRVDLAGGTLDLWPLYNFHKDCVTINLAIDIYTTAIITPRKDKKIILSSKDTGTKLEFKNLGELINDKSMDLKLLKVHCAFWKPKLGFELETQSDSPIGGGIAGSSSLNISLCGAFSKFTGQKIDKEALVRLAGNLEAEVLLTPTGCQDYFPPLHGGLGVIELTALGPKHKKVNVDIKKFSERFTLVYTGRPHHSGMNNWQIYKAHVDGDKAMFDKIEKIKDVALEMKQVVLKKDVKKLADVFNREYQARIELSPVFTSPEIERLKKISGEHGALALKICGAGGGGCVFLWSDPARKSILKEICEREGFQVLRASPTQKGLEVKISSKS